MKKRNFFLATVFTVQAASWASSSDGLEILVDPKASIDAEREKSSEFPRRIEAEGMTISFSETAVKQGHVFWIEVDAPNLDKQSVVWTELDGIPTVLFPWKNILGKSVLAAIVGVPFSEKPGISDLKIKVAEGNDLKVVAAKIRVLSAEADRQAELLNLPEERVIPQNQEAITKLAEEDKEIDAIFDIRSSLRAWDKTMGLPFDGKFRMSSP
ncbi:MAG: hypothetical protein EB023_15475, partial [Flavobacteriia bacterium]|nr:hypothetical protein [Flavobacteriia bacterium]